MESEAPSAPPPEPISEIQDFSVQTALQVIAVEFIIDSHRINAEVRHPGAPRRLVDYLNSVDGPRIAIHNCAVGQPEDPASVGQFNDAQIHRNAIIMAMPRGNTTFTVNSIEVVRKRPVPAVLVLPGYDVAGNIYMVAEIDPNNTPLIGNHNFLPVTDATVTPAGAPERAWHEDLLVINMTRCLLYVPK